VSGALIFVAMFAASAGGDDWFPFDQ